MKISREDVKGVFADLLSGRTSRECADRWAYAVMQASENNELVFVPPNEQERIWEGVMYLYGIDLQVEPGDYMFSEDDIRQVMLEKLGT